jgi:hypothetical protein
MSLTLFDAVLEDAALGDLNVPGQDPYNDGQVLVYKRNFGGPTQYTYAAIRANGKWYLTGTDNKAKSWDELVESHLQFASIVMIPTQLVVPAWFTSSVT